MKNLLTDIILWRTLSSSPAPSQGRQKKNQAMKATISTPTVEAAPVQVGYSEEKLDEFRGIINRMLKEHKTDLEEADEALREIEAPKYLEAAGSEHITRDEAMSKKTRAENMIGELNMALQRMKAGTYGICRVTGQRIPEARLRLVPYATTIVLQ